MSKKCPKCGIKAQDYHQFCPNADCEYDFPTEVTPNNNIEDKYHNNTNNIKSTEPSGKKESKDLNHEDNTLPISKNEEEKIKLYSLDKKHSQPQNCSICGAPDIYQDCLCLKCFNKQSETNIINNNNENESDLTKPATDETLILSHDEIVICQHCDKQIMKGMKICCYCEKSVEEVSTTDFFKFKNSIGGHIVSNYNYNEHIVSRTRAAFNISTPPIKIFFNSGKTYREKKMSFIDLQIQNIYPQILENVIIKIHSSTVNKELEGNISTTIIPGMAIRLKISGYKPNDNGEDAMSIYATGTTVGSDEFHLYGTISVNISPQPKVIQKVSIDIKAPEVGDQNINMPTFQQTGDDAPIREIERWIPVEMLFDQKQVKRQEKFFPKACLDPSDCKLGIEIIESIQNLAPETSATAAISTNEGKVYFVIPGNTLLMGRDPKINHVPLMMEPIDQYGRSNLTISRNHCRIFIRENRVYIRDMSKGGIVIDKQRIPANENVMLPSDEIINFPNNLEIQIKIFTDDIKIIAVLLKRLNNKNHHAYLLAHGPLPAGNKNDLALRVGSGNELYGFFYYNPFLTKWFFLNAGEFPGTSGGIQLNDPHEILLGNYKCWFSNKKS